MIALTPHFAQIAKTSSISYEKFEGSSQIKRKVFYKTLNIELSDTLKAHVMNAEGNYEKIDKRGKVLLCSQQYFCEEAVKEAEALIPEHSSQSRVFIPAEPIE